MLPFLRHSVLPVFHVECGIQRPESETGRFLGSRHYKPMTQMYSWPVSYFWIPNIGNNLFSFGGHKPKVTTSTFWTLSSQQSDKNVLITVILHRLIKNYTTGEVISTSGSWPPSWIFTEQEYVILDATPSTWISLCRSNVHLVSVWPWPLTSDLKNFSGNAQSYDAHLYPSMKALHYKYRKVASRDV